MITIAIVEDDNEYRQQYREYLGKMETQLGKASRLGNLQMETGF